jgi:hypothetical protein
MKDWDGQRSGKGKRKRDTIGKSRDMMRKDGEAAQICPRHPVTISRDRNVRDSQGCR